MRGKREGRHKKSPGVCVSGVWGAGGGGGGEIGVPYVTCQIRTW